MKKISIVLLVILAALFFAHPVTAGKRSDKGQPFIGDLSATEISYLVFIREEEKLARDTYVTLHGVWKDQIFLNISWSEQRHMDAMKRMLDFYGVQDPVVSDAIGVFSDPVFDDLYSGFIDRGDDSLLEALHVGALVEELDIRDLRIAIANTNEKPLLGSYQNLLAGARNHLRAFVARIEALGVDYQAQELEQQDVDAIVGDYGFGPPGGFAINPGLNDVWFYPGTPGQGFSISVFPGQKTVFLVWFTYDTVLPQTGSSAFEGDPGQRWLVAQGNYFGAEAELEIGSMSGGLFDSSEPVPVLTPAGSILLRFESCDSGSVFYDIPSIGRTGMIPIQRINSENVAQCHGQQAGKR